jgi:hypothetical protein
MRTPFSCSLQWRGGERCQAKRRAVVQIEPESPLLVEKQVRRDHEGSYGAEDRDDCSQSGELACQRGEG